MFHATAVTLQGSDTLANDPHRQSLAAKRIDRPRGLRSFLTWSFFLAQIAAGEMFIGANARAGQADETFDKAGDGEMDDGTAGPFLAAANVQAASDAVPGNDPEDTAAAIKAGAGPDSAGASPAWGKPADMPVAADAGVFVTGGGAGGSVGADADLHSLLPLGLDALLSNDGLVFDGSLRADLNLDAPALLGDTIEAAVDLVDGTLSSLGAAPFLENIFDGLTPGLFHSGEGPAGSLMALAASDGTALSISAELAASGPHYTDLLLALTDDGPPQEAMTAAPGGALLHGLPVIGDAFAAPPHPADPDHNPDPTEITVSASSLADHIGLTKGIGDLWS